MWTYAIIVAMMTIPCSISQIQDPSIVLNEVLPATITAVNFHDDWSPSQLGKDSTSEILFVFKSNMDTSSSSNIYDCTNVLLEFAVPDPLVTPMELEVTVTKKVARTLMCNIHWGDPDETSGVLRLDSTTNVAKFEYTTFGIYEPWLDCGIDGRCSESRSESCVITDSLFDASFKSPENPMVFVATQLINLHSYMQLSSLCATWPPEIYWTINQIVNGSVLVAFTDFEQPNTSVLLLSAETLHEGDYLIYLEIAFPTAGGNMWKFDSMFLSVVLPELIAFIEGGDEVTVNHGEPVFLDATFSKDPLVTLHADEPIETMWSVIMFTGNVNKQYMAEYPDRTLAGGGKQYSVLNGTELYLLIDTTIFPENSQVLVMFKIRKGDRVSSRLQKVFVTTTAIPLGIQCVYNCNKRRDRKYIDDKVEFDAILPDSLTDTSSLTFEWKVTICIKVFGLCMWVGVWTSRHTTGFDTRSLGLMKGVLSPGQYYRIILTVRSPDHSNSEAAVYVFINPLPYDGECTITTSGVAARDWLTLNCTGWRGVDDRYDKNGNKDSNPILTFQVSQNTTGAFVLMEPLVTTRSMKTFIILKVGDPDNSYLTKLFVRVMDMYQGFVEVVLEVNATPAFAWYNVTPSVTGASLVEGYSNGEFVEDAAQMRGMGKHDMIISLISSICSHFHMVVLPIWTPPVPYVPDNSAVLDLSTNGSSDTATLDNTLTAANNITIDPATLAIQGFLQNLTSLLRAVVEQSIVNGNRGDDKMFTSMVTNAFTNIAYKDNFINLDTKIDLVYLARIVGNAALEPIPNTTDDQSAVLARMSGEIFHMARAVVNSVVPNSLRDARVVPDFSSSQGELDDLLSVVGDDFDLEEAIMSPDERAYLYMQMQAQLVYELDTGGHKETAKDAANMSIELSRNVQQKLKLCKMCSNADSENTEQLVKKNTAETLKTGLTSMPGASFRVDGLLQDDGTSDNPTTPSSVSAYEFEENAFMYDNDGSSSLVTSNVLRLDVQTSASYTHPQSTTFDQVVMTPAAVVVVPLVDEEDASMFSYHKFLYQSSKDYLCMIIEPHDTKVVKEYELYIRFKQSPSVLEYDILVTVSAFLRWQVCIRPEQMMGHQGITYMAVAMTEETIQISYNYTLITVGCMVWEEAATKWHSNKCEMEWIPRLDRISCYCNNVTDLTFGNSFFVAPNTIDFSSVFLKFSPLNQAAVMGCLGGILLIYILAVIFLAGLDRRDMLKWGVTPLRDNLFGDENFYIIKVFTGMRRGAGTQSRIAFVLTGIKASTGPREMFDGLREDFPTGSVLSFFMATKVHLGQLEYLHIWHDNEGPDDKASWYLNQVVFYDIQAKETYTFIAERWLSLEDGIETRITSSAQDVPVQFETRFFFQTRDRLSESHMWVSIAYRPQTSSFTRVQRATCALVYILLTMIANAMYFNPEPDFETPPLLQVGPIRITLTQLYVSIISALITTPAVMLVIFLFKRSKRRPVDPNGNRNRKSCCHCCLRCPCTPFCQSLFYSRKEEERKMYEEDVRSHLLSSETPDFSGSFYLPFWFEFIAWFVAVAAIVTSAFFILLYSMEWGKQKSEEWLSTVLLSMLQSMLVVDPVLVICLSFVFACIFRSMKQDSALNVDVIVNNYKKLRWSDKQGCDFSYRVLRSIKEEYEWFKNVPRHVTPPMRGNDLEKELNEFKHKDKLTTMFRDIIFNIFLIFLVLSICYSNRDDRSFNHVRHIENTIVHTSKGVFGFEQISRPGDVFRWVNNTVLPEIFPTHDLTGEPLHWTNKVFMNGGNHFRLGPPRLRQLRVVPELCRIPYWGMVNCYDEYSILGEDTEGYCLGWEPGPCPKFMKLFNESIAAWNFTSAFDTWGLPVLGVYKTYGGGGYIASFDINLEGSRAILDELVSTLWLDRQTRAVLLEFTLYSAATNIFVYNVFMCEFPETGGVIRSRSIYPLRVYTHIGPSGTYAMICEVIFVIYLFILFIKIIVRIYRQRCGYFRQVWQVYDILLLLMAAAAVGMFIMRLLFTTLTVNAFKEDKKKFVNFGHVVFWDMLLTTFLAFFLFLITIRILEVFASSKRVQALVKIFSDCGWDLASFGVAFIHIFIGFAICGHFLFGTNLVIYHDVYNSMTTLFLAILGVTQFDGIVEVQPILSRVFYCSYILTVLFFTLTIFMSILGGSIDAVMHDTINNDEQDLVDFMMHRFTHLLVKPSPKQPRLGGRYFVNRVAPAVSTKQNTSLKSRNKSPLNDEGTLGSSTDEPNGGDDSAMNEQANDSFRDNDDDNDNQSIRDGDSRNTASKLEDVVADMNDSQNESIDSKNRSRAASPGSENEGSIGSENPDGDEGPDSTHDPIKGSSGRRKSIPVSVQACRCM